MSLEEIALWIFGLFLLIDLFGCLEDLIGETLELAAVPGLVLSMGVENADLIQETIKLSRPRPVFFVVTRPLYASHGAVCIPLLFLTLGGADSLSFFYSLVSMVASSARAYLLAISNISLDVLGLFMVSLWIKDESLSPFLKNMMIDLSSTSGMMFLLL
jgi:hypothetical protein